MFRTKGFSLSFPRLFPAAARASRYDEHEAFGGFGHCPELAKGGTLGQLHSRVLDSVLEAVTWDTKLLFAPPSTFDTLSMCLRAILRQFNSHNSNPDARLVRCSGQFMKSLHDVGSYVYDDQPMCFPTPGGIAEFLSLSRC